MYIRELIIAGAFLNTVTVTHLSTFDKTLNAVAVVVAVYAISAEFKSWYLNKNKVPQQPNRG